MSRYLITGGCGFIGSHMAEFLIKLGHDVIIVDDLSSGYLKNIHTIKDKVDLIIQRVEECDIDSMGSFDGVFHLAAQASVPYSVDHFFESSSINVLSSLRVIDYCARLKCPLVYASSSAIYGNLPFGDETKGSDLLSPYSADKLVSEVYSSMSNKLFGLSSYGLRFFNVYGPRQDPSNPYSGVISIFISRLLSNEHLIINGGHQTRDFIYVEDIVSGIWSAHNSLLSHPVADYVNLLTGVSVSINDLASLLMKITGKEVGCIYKELSKGDPAISLGSTKKMREQLNFTPIYCLEDGLNLTVDWMMKNHD